ncbi:MAG: hypothetical protein ACFFDY_13255 [Candidatus Thorarchaeota archaeon]
MEDNEKMSNENLIMLWGFIFLIMGALGMVQIGLLDGLNDFLIIGSIPFIIGIIILVSIAFIDKKKNQ